MFSSPKTSVYSDGALIYCVGVNGCSMKLEDGLDKECGSVQGSWINLEA